PATADAVDAMASDAIVHFDRRLPGGDARALPLCYAASQATDGHRSTAWRCQSLRSAQRSIGSSTPRPQGQEGSKAAFAGPAGQEAQGGIPGTGLVWRPPPNRAMGQPDGAVVRQPRRPDCFDPLGVRAGRSPPGPGGRLLLQQRSADDSPAHHRAVHLAMEHRSDLRGNAGVAGVGKHAPLVPPIGAAGGAFDAGTFHGGGVAVVQASGQQASSPRQRHALLPQTGSHLRRRLVYGAPRAVAAVAFDATSWKTAMSRYSAPTPAPNAPVAPRRRSLSGQNAKIEAPKCTTFTIFLPVSRQIVRIARCPCAGRRSRDPEARQKPPDRSARG